MKNNFSPLDRPWVVIPTYNESANIKAIITEIFAQKIPNLTILIVDDQSPDGTADQVRHLMQTYPTLQLLSRAEKNGLGRAYVAGFQHALDNQATAIIQMDADFSHAPQDIPRLLATLSQNDVALGSRYSQGISVINWPLRRLLISIGGNVYASLITGMPYKDLTGGFKAWRSSALQAIDLPHVNVTGYGFQVTTTFRAWKKKLSITEVPIVFTERREGQSKMSKNIIIEAAWIVWRLRLFNH